jgi:hypothetical protein
MNEQLSVEKGRAGVLKQLPGNQVEEGVGGSASNQSERTERNDPRLASFPSDTNNCW